MRKTVLLSIVLILFGLVFSVIYHETRLEKSHQEIIQEEIPDGILEEYITWTTKDYVRITTYILKKDESTYLITVTSRGGITCTEIFPPAQEEELPEDEYTTEQ